MQKVKISLQSWLLVSVQFGALLYIFTSASYTAHSILGLLVQLGGILLGFWAVLSIGVLNFSVFPEPKDKIKIDNHRLLPLHPPPYVCGSFIADFTSGDRLLHLLASFSAVGPNYCGLPENHT